MDYTQGSEVWGKQESYGRPIHGLIHTFNRLIGRYRVRRAEDHLGVTTVYLDNEAVFSMYPRRSEGKWPDRRKVWPVWREVKP